MVIYSEFWVNLFTFGNQKIEAITLFPFIFICAHYKDITDSNVKKRLNVLINHEKIHIQQEKEMLVIFFYLIYVLNWILNIFLYKLSFEDMYKNIIFEIEAYKEQGNMEYLSTRKFWNWINYFKYKA